MRRDKDIIGYLYNDTEQVIRKQIALELEHERDRYIEGTPVEDRGVAFVTGLGVFTTAIYKVEGRW